MVYTLKIVITKLTLETRTRMPGVSYAVDSQSVNVKMVEFLVVVMECISGDNLVCRYPFACFQVTFQENLTIKISQTSDIQDLYSERDFWFGDRVKSDINTKSKIPKFPRLKLSHPVCPEQS